MSFIRGYNRRPQRSWLRRAGIQVHHWTGLALAAWAVMMGLSGCVLVFREDLERLAGIDPWHDLAVGGAVAEPSRIVEQLHAAYPGVRMVSLSAPGASSPVYVATVQARGQSARIAIHPVSGRILGRMPRRLPARWEWLATLQNLHETLLSGPKGREANGILAGCLLATNLTGMIAWWPGLRTMGLRGPRLQALRLQAVSRALKVDFRRNWRRIHFDLHRAAGFWTFAIVSFWAVSGIYFAWPGKAFLLIERISPVISARPPAVRVDRRPDMRPADLKGMIATATALEPGATLRAIAFPSSPRAPLEISLQRPGTRGAEFADTLYFDPLDGRCLAIWRYGVNQSLGDWLIWLPRPLHFGTRWGSGVKVLWGFLALSLPLLAVTGVVNYWNRYLRRHLPLRPAKV